MDKIINEEDIKIENLIYEINGKQKEFSKNIILK